MAVLRSWGVGESSQLLFSGSWDTMLKVWKVGLNGHAGIEPMRTLNGHSHRIEDLTVTGDGNALLSASWDSTVRLWQIGERAPIECVCEYKREDYSEIFNCVATAKATAPGSSTAAGANDVVVGSADGMIHLFPLCPTAAASGRGGATGRPDAFVRFETIREEEERQQQQRQQQQPSLAAAPAIMLGEV